MTLVVTTTKESWLRNNLTKSNFENFYWMLPLLGLINQYKVHKYKVAANSAEGAQEPEGRDD